MFLIFLLHKNKAQFLSITHIGYDTLPTHPLSAYYDRQLPYFSTPTTLRLGGAVEDELQVCIPPHLGKSIHHRTHLLTDTYLGLILISSFFTIQLYFLLFDGSAVLAR
jgi:hypothetical protein